MHSPRLRGVPVFAAFKIARINQSKLRACSFFSLSYPSQKATWRVSYRANPTRLGIVALMVTSSSTTESGAENSVRSVIVPAAGMGTRFLPATKTVPKEAATSC